MSDYSKLILIFGQPRSGTTWIGKIFDSHPWTIYRHEPDRYRPLAIPPLALPSPNEEAHAKLSAFASGLVDIRSTVVASKPPVFPKAYFSRPQYELFRTSAAISNLLGKTIGLTECFYVPHIPLDKTRVVWKSINSVGRIGLIMQALPGSKMVFIVRHPCGQIASMLKMDQHLRKQGYYGMADDFKHFELLLESDVAQKYKLSVSQLRSLSDVERLAWRWVIYNEKAIVELQQLADAMVVRYEDVCLDPPRFVKAMFDHVGLEVSAQTTNFLRRSTSSENARYYSVFKDPAVSAWKWRTQLSGTQIDLIYGITTDTPPGALALAQSVPAAAGDTEQPV